MPVTYLTDFFTHCIVKLSIIVYSVMCYCASLWVVGLLEELC